MSLVHVFTDDLLFGSRLEADLAAAGHEVTLGPTPDRAAEAIVADLTHDADARIAALAPPRPPTLAFFSMSRWTCTPARSQRASSWSCRARESRARGRRCSRACSLLRVDLAHLVEQRLRSTPHRLDRLRTGERSDDPYRQRVGVRPRWGLTGTILEKNMGEMHTMLNWAKPGDYGSKSDFEKRFGQLNQFDHLTGDEKVQQFREGCADGAFFQLSC